MIENHNRADCYLKIFKKIDNAQNHENKDGIEVISKKIIEMFQKLKEFPHSCEEYNQHWEKIVCTINLMLSLYHEKENANYLLN